MLARKADIVFISFPGSEQYFGKVRKMILTGNPLRLEILNTDREEARAALGIPADAFYLLSFAGSLGAQRINEAMVDFIAVNAKAKDFYQTHATGERGWEWMPEEVKKKGVDLSKSPDIDMREFIYNMPTVLTAADVVISRAGSSSCNEIAATGTPCILIPSPNVTDNHQEKNARALEAQGGAVVLLETECTGQRLMQEITAILGDKERQAKMHSALQRMSVPDSAERICDVMEKLARSKAKE
jgi:UDP-N-acetylglucosamine--N-acetylmuramyl-(pentapeptide) pyrophosphoryl-undecaprenol N-acetylglucosamine transferase